MTQRHLSLLAAAVLVVVPLSLLGESPAAPAAARFVPLAGYDTSRPAAAEPLGPLAPLASLRVDVVLAPSHPAQLLGLVKEVDEPHSVQFHRWLTPAQFSAKFGPSAAEVAAARVWLGQVGLHPGTLAGFTLPVRASSQLVAAAFHTRLVRYRLASGRIVYQPSRPPSIAAAAAPYVEDVAGLNDLAMDEPHLRDAPASSHAHVSSPTACADASATASTADTYSTRYGITDLFAQGWNGANETIAVFEAAAHVANDVTTYFTCFGLTNPVSTVAIDGGDVAGPGTDEADLDIEQVATQAPAATILSYETPNTATGDIDAWNAIVHQDVAQVISTSWGLCEGLSGTDSPGTATAAMATLFQQAAVQGQTIVAASGDDGSEDCYSANSSHLTALQVDFPASDPYVLAAGGSEESGNVDVAWLFGGGGLSREFALPSWQQGYLAGTWSSPAPPCGSQCREVPDLSADAGTAQAFFTNGAWNAFRGTSISAPLLAGMFGDINDSCANAVGLVGPDLYAYASAQWSPSGPYGYELNDVTSGNNDAHNAYGGLDWVAGVGYDLTSGLGTPIAGGLACPQVSGVSPSGGAPGSQVTVSGSNLQNASVYFGSSPASVVSKSATQQVVVVPSGSGTVSLSALTPIGSGVATTSFTYSTADNTATADTTTTTTAPAPVVPPPTTTTTLAPLLPHLVIRGVLGPVSGSTAAFRLVCAQRDCSGVVQLSHQIVVAMRVGKRLVTRARSQAIGSQRYSIRSGGTATVRVKLNATGLLALHKAAGGKIAVQERVSLTGGVGGQRDVILISPPKPKAATKKS
jgi:subtilase family serine protease